LKNFTADHEKSISVKKMDVKKFGWEWVFFQKIFQNTRKKDRLPLHDNFRDRKRSEEI